MAHADLRPDLESSVPVPDLNLLKTPKLRTPRTFSSDLARSRLSVGCERVRTQRPTIGTAPCNEVRAAVLTLSPHPLASVLRLDCAELSSAVVHSDN